MLKGKVKFTETKFGTGILIIPKIIVHDSNFPLKVGKKYNLEVEGNKIKIE